MGQTTLASDASRPGRWLLCPTASETCGHSQTQRRQPPTGDRYCERPCDTTSHQPGVNPIIDPTFSASRHGFRPGRKAHGAVKQLRSFIAEGYRIAVDVDVDLSKFFDRIDHDILMHRL